MTATEHRRINSAFIALIIGLLMLTITLSLDNSTSIKECEVKLYEKLTNQEYPFTKDLK